MTKRCTLFLSLFLLLTLNAGCSGDDTLKRGIAMQQQNLEIHVLNVGQGHAALVVGPDGTTLLVDGGRSGTASDRVIPYLTSLGMPPGSSFDYMVLTHRDTDHMNGLTKLLQLGYDVRSAIWDNGSSKTSSSINDFLSAADNSTAGGAAAIPLGQVIPLGDGARATCVAVHGNVLDHGPVSGATANENDLSVALLVEYGDFDFIVTGDVGGGDDDKACTGRVHSSANVETPLAQALTGGSAPLLSSHGVEVALIGHHGSHGATNVDFFNLLNPAVALIGVGKNSYQHPRKVVVETVLGAAASCVAAPAALVLQTDEGDARKSSKETSFAGHVVGDVVISSSGSGSYDISATGSVYDGPDERVAAGLPAVFSMDEPVSGCSTNADCDDGNPCTVDTCGGGSCTNVVGNAGVVCRPATGACDVAETCDGSTTACPADSYAPNGTSCDDGDLCNGVETCLLGACTAGTPVACDDGNRCTVDTCAGSTGLCSNVTGNAGTVCRAASGDCDVAETCTGSSATCPTDGYKSSGIVCRAAAGVCDAADTCSGTSATCPADLYQPAGTSCRASTDTSCDPAETCSGAATTCPTDINNCATTDCGNGVCEGNGENCSTCPLDCRCAGKNCSAACCGDGICKSENAKNCPVDCS